MSIKTVSGKVKFQDINVEDTEEDYKLFIDSGKDKNFLLSKDDIEELHMGFGDDLFYRFITNMTVVTDKEGERYYKKFLKDYEVPEPEDSKESTWIDKFKDNPIHYIKGEIYRFQTQSYSTRGSSPQYIIMSKKTFQELQAVIYDYYRKVNDSGAQYNPHQPYINDIQNWHFEDIPIAILQVDKHHFNIV